MATPSAASTSSSAPRAGMLGWSGMAGNHSPRSARLSQRLPANGLELYAAVWFDPERARGFLAPAGPHMKLLCQPFPLKPIECRSGRPKRRLVVDHRVDLIGIEVERIVNRVRDDAAE